MKNHIYLTYLILFSLTGLHTAPATTLTTDVTLTWDRNPESNIIRYKVYYLRVYYPQYQYRWLATITGTTATVAVPSNWNVYFRVTAINSVGLESPLSDKVRWP